MKKRVEKIMNTKVKPLVKENFPETYNFIEKGIDQPLGYYDWQFEIYTQVSDFILMNYGDHKFTKKHYEKKNNSIVSGYRLLSFPFQTLFTSRKIVESLMSSEGNLSAYDMPAKNKDYLFMLPRKSLKAPDGKEARSIAVHFSEAEFNIIIELRNNQLGGNLQSEDSITTTCNTLTYKYDLTQGESKDVKFHTELLGRHLPKDDQEFLAKVNNLGFKLYWLAVAKPEMISEDYPKGFGIKRNPTFWLGKGYEMQKDRTEPQPFRSHASPSFHIRKGHFRNQPCGAGRKARRIIWLEPTYVGGF